MNAIECDQLTRNFGRTRAVDNLTLAVPMGSVFALLGANGAGKSTTLKLLLNLLRPSAGRATVLGCETTRFGKEIFQRIGYVAEDQAESEWMSVRELLAFCRPLYPTWDDTLASTLRAQYGLPEDRALKKLSRGMKMKARLLATLCFRPELLILDEPFSGLDPQVRDDLIAGLLETIAGDRPSTVVISSHDIAEVERLADWVGILAEGRLVLAEPIAQLQARFRRIEVVGPGMGERTSDPWPRDWLKVQTPSSTVMQFVHQGFGDPAAAEAQIRMRFPRGAVSIFPLTLRDIFLAHSHRPAADQGKASS
jgi:ABC-2 type transport system ATP-binding protein